MPVWIKVESALRRHRKVIRLGRMMGLTDERLLVGGLVLLWLAARESAPDGNITGWNAREVAAAAGFDEQDADQLYLALHECGFLEGGDGNVHLHDWMEHNGQFTRDAERMRNVRARSRTAPNSLKCSRLARAPGSGAGAVQESESTPLSDADAPDAPVLTPPSPKRDIQKQANAKDWLAGFEEFWKAYPHRANSSRKDALKVWVRIQPKDYSTADDLFTAILAALEESKAAWRAEGTDERHTPHHSVWLNRELWSNHADQP